ncbi:MAG: hypothetical protein HY762_05150 [Planctomycetes bacterium]|nr:hypothetical protein [Planctomycetota bacterium]
MLWGLFGKKKPAGDKDRKKLSPLYRKRPLRKLSDADNAVEAPMAEAEIEPSSVILPGERDRLGQILLDEKIITWEDLQKAIALQQRTTPKKFLGEILIDMKLLNEEMLVSAISKQTRLPYIKISDYRIPKEVLNTIPRSFIETYQVLPIDKMGRVLIIAMVNPNNREAITELEKATGLKIKQVLCRLSEFKQAVHALFKSQGEPESPKTEIIHKVETIPSFEERIAPPGEPANDESATKIIPPKAPPPPPPPVAQPAPPVIATEIPVVVKEEAVAALNPVSEEEFRLALRAMAIYLALTGKQYDKRERITPAEKVTEDEFNFFTTA